MLVLLAFACTGPAAEPFPATALLDIEGVSIGEISGGFAATRSYTESQWMRVVLTSYPDPCAALTGYYEELTDALSPDPWVLYEPEWSDVLADAEHWFPSDAYDTIEIEYWTEGDPSALEREYSFLYLEGQAQVNDAQLVLTANQTGFDAFQQLVSVDGRSGVTALDPMTGEGEVTLQVGLDDIEGTLDFSFELPDSCPDYLVAQEAYVEAQPDGCRRAGGCG